MIRNGFSPACVQTFPRNLGPIKDTMAISRFNLDLAYIVSLAGLWERFLLCMCGVCMYACVFANIFSLSPLHLKIQKSLIIDHFQCSVELQTAFPPKIKSLGVRATPQSRLMCWLLGQGFMSR